MFKQLEELLPIYTILHEHKYQNTTKEISNDYQHLALKRINQIILIKCANKDSQQILQSTYQSSKFSKDSQYFAYQLSTNRCAIKNIKITNYPTIIIKVPSFSEIQEFDNQNRLHLSNSLQFGDKTEWLVCDLKTKSIQYRIHFPCLRFSIKATIFNGLIYNAVSNQIISLQSNKIKRQFKGTGRYLKLIGCIHISDIDRKVLKLWNIITKKLIRKISFENLEVDRYVNIEKTIFVEQNHLLMLLKKKEKDSPVIYSLDLVKQVEVSSTVCQIFSQFL